MAYFFFYTFFFYYFSGKVFLNYFSFGQYFCRFLFENWKIFWDQLDQPNFFLDYLFLSIKILKYEIVMRSFFHNNSVFSNTFLLNTFAGFFIGTLLPLNHPPKSRCRYRFWWSCQCQCRFGTVVPSRFGTCGTDYSPKVPMRVPVRLPRRFGADAGFSALGSGCNFKCKNSV